MHDVHLSHKTFLALAVPFTISTITQPLLGAVDTAVVGRLENASYIGGVAIGTVIINTFYWLLGFLRIGATSFAAQSLSSEKEEDIYYAYFRPLFMAVIVGFAFIFFRSCIIDAALSIYKPEAEVIPHARTYFNIVIWGAPFVLITYVNMGWMIGRKFVRQTLILQISSNLINILLDLVFVLGLKMGVAGAAWATLISQIYGLILGCFFLYDKLSVYQAIKYRADLFNKTALKRMMEVNFDLMVRTMCFLVMTNMFIIKGSELGTNILAANAILFQIQYLIVFFYDGLSSASSVFVGNSVGRRDVDGFYSVEKICWVDVVIISVFLSIMLFIFKGWVISLFTDLDYIKAICDEYMIWLIIYPYIIGVGCLYFGIFTGAAYTAPIRNSMLGSSLVFIIAYYTAVPVYGNHGLWLAFMLFSLIRCFLPPFYRKRLIKEFFPPKHASERISRSLLRG